MISNRRLFRVNSNIQQKLMWCFSSLLVKWSGLPSNLQSLKDKTLFVPQQTAFPSEPREGKLHWKQEKIRSVTRTWCEPVLHRTWTAWMLYYWVTRRTNHSTHHTQHVLLCLFCAVYTKSLVHECLFVTLVKITHSWDVGFHPNIPNIWLPWRQHGSLSDDLIRWGSSM